MALIECPECAHKVSTLAASCPGCGWPVSASPAEPIGEGSTQATYEASVLPGYGPVITYDAAPLIPRGDDVSAATNAESGSLTGGAEYQYPPPSFVPAQAPATNQSQPLAPARVQQHPPTQHRLWWMFALLVLGCTGVAIYVNFFRVVHPDRETCVTAVNKLYDAVSWKSDYHHKLYSFEEGVDSCLKLSKKDVECITQDSDQPFLCSNVSGISIERPHSGLFCFARVDNTTQTKTWGRCAFNAEECESRRSDAEGSAVGAKLDQCQSFDRLYGVLSATQEEGKTHGWYGMTPDETECHLFWRKNAAELRNVEPGCREVLYGAEPGKELPEPARPAVPSGPRPAAPWCIHGDRDSPDECQPTEEQCEAKRRDMKYAILYACRQQSQAAFFVIGNSAVAFYKDLAACKLQADIFWANGVDATDCEVLR